MKRLLKFLHEVGTVGLMGGAATMWVLSYAGERMPAAEHAAVRRVIHLLAERLLLPSLALVLVSGLLAMAAHRAYQNAGWAWIKLATTVLVFEGTLVAVAGPAQAAAEITAAIAAGDTSTAHALPHVLRHERGGQVVLLALSLANIALAVWRPKLRRRRAARAAGTATTTAPAEADA